MKTKFETLWAEKTGKETVNALNRRYFDAYYCKDKEEALNKALEFIPENSSVCWGGSITISEIGLIDKLRNGNYKLLDRDKANSPEEFANISRQGFFSDIFLMSSNAVTQDGQLVNIDGMGNRVASLIFGPKSVIVIAGINKIRKNIDDAINRARGIAAPMNMQRFADKHAPCSDTGKCFDCISEDCICSNIVITRISKPAKKIKVLLVGENLGF